MTLDEEMTAALMTATPFAADERLTIVELGAGGELLAAALLDRFPRATIVAFAGSEPSRTAAAGRLSRFADRARVRAFDVASLDWWDLMSGADLVVSWRCLHQLNDAKKQYLYKAVADRLSPRGALLIGDGIAPQRPPGPPTLPAANPHAAALFHHLVWLRHAGFAAVDCLWLKDGHAVFGGFKQAAASAPPLPAGS
jgi:tRNA (cmo5U34)-methyltransferase